MQIILTEEEYLKLKRQHEEDKKIYVKRIDVMMALKELETELRGTMDPSINSFGMSYVPKEQWIKMFERFAEKIG